MGNDISILAFARLVLDASKRRSSSWMRQLGLIDAWLEVKLEVDKLLNS